MVQLLEMSKNMYYQKAPLLLKFERAHLSQTKVKTAQREWKQI